MKTLNVSRNYLLFGSLGGLAAGLLLGIIAKRGDVTFLVDAAAFLEPIGTLWINSLRMIVLPLIIAYIITAVASFEKITTTFSIGGGAVLTHLGFMLAGFTIMLLLVPPLIQSYEVTPEVTEALRSAVVEMPEAADPAGPEGGVTDAISRIIPTNLFRAATEENILQLFAAALLFALALTRVTERYRNIIADFFKAIIETLHVLIGWILMAMPIAVFVLIFAMAIEIGAELLSALVYFVLVFCGLLILLTILLYVITPLLGRVSLRQFARAVSPAQAVAIGTRSSMVCLPALIEGARDRLRLPESVVGLVMPLSVSMFKINMAVSGPINVFFLSHIYGVELTPLAIAAFFAAYLPVTFTMPGIPSGGLFISLPLYVGLGLPVEGVILLKTVDAIPDIFKTLVNVTEDMSVATLVARFASGSKTASTPLESAVPA